MKAYTQYLNVTKNSLHFLQRGPKNHMVDASPQNLKDRAFSGTMIIYFSVVHTVNTCNPALLQARGQVKAGLLTYRSEERL